MANNKLLKPRSVAEILNVSEKTLANHRSLGSGPKFYKDSGVVRYPAEALQKHINENMFGGGSQYKPKNLKRKNRRDKQ